MRPSLFGIALAAATALMLLSALTTARAADSADQAAYEAAFDAMQRDPGSSDKALAYAEAAIKVGDLEGAIGALERLLIFNPDLPRIQLELGVLYYRLGSNDLARGYLAPLTDRPDAPEDVRARAKDYLGRVDQLASAHRVTGGLIAGFRYQTDANFGPSGSSISLLGIRDLFTVPSNLAPRGDGNFFGLATVNYVYDLQRADPLTVEANLTTYGQKQFRSGLDIFDLSLTQIDVGPRVGLPWWLEGSSVRPYVVGDFLTLGGSPFLSSYGGGLGGVAPVLDRVDILANIEIQNRQYPMDPLRPRIENRNGDFLAVRLQPRYALGENQLVSLIGEYDQTFASQRYERNRQLVVGPFYEVRFEAPFAPFARPWTGTVGGTYVRRYYNAPDALIDPFNTRRDSEYDLGGSLEIGIVEGVSVVLQLQQQWVNSNIPNYKYTNTSGVVAVSLSF